MSHHVVVVNQNTIVTSILEVHLWNGSIRIVLIEIEMFIKLSK